MAKRIMIASMVALLMGLGLYASAQVRRGDRGQAVRVKPVVLPTEVKSEAISSAWPDVIAYDNNKPGSPGFLYVDDDVYTAVRFTPINNFILYSVYLSVWNEYHNATAGCNLYVGPDNGSGLPVWPATYLGNIPAPLPHATWKQLDLAEPIFCPANQDFHIVYGPAPGGEYPGTGWWNLFDDDGSTTQRSGIGLYDGETWEIVGDGDAFIRAGGEYVEASYGVDVIAGPDTSGFPGDTVSVTFTVKNTGTATDSFDCRILSTHGCTIDPPSHSASLGSAEDTMFVAYVYIPSDVAYGDTILIKADATSLTSELATDCESLRVFIHFPVIDITTCDPMWWPECGNVTTFTARIYWWINGQCVFPGPPKIIYFTLDSVSHERGICLNKGIGDTTVHDLHLNTYENLWLVTPTKKATENCDYVTGCESNTVGPHEHWFEVRTKEPETEVTVQVLSEDYGSWGWIHAWSPGVKEILPREPGWPTTCTFGSAKTKIPRDENGNNIADSWGWDDYLGTDPEWDEEATVSIYGGDGLTRYEEYRGFTYYYSFGHGYARLMPSAVDLFIYRENEAWGIEDALFAADEIHFVTPEDMNSNPANMGNPDNPPAPPGFIFPEKNRRCINFNGGFAHKVDQHGLWLAVGGGDGRRGNWGGVGGPELGPPETAGRVNIYSDNISSACGPASGPVFRAIAFSYFRMNAQFSYDARDRRDELIKDTIGHELGHGMNLRDHPRQLVTIRLATRDTTDGWMNVFPPSTYIKWNMDGAGGDRQCVMRYEFPEIRQSVALSFRPKQWDLASNDPDWTPTLPSCWFGYCSDCRLDIMIDDADHF